MRLFRRLSAVTTAVALSLGIVAPSHAVVGGTATNQPSLAYVGLGEQQCTGALVTPEWVLSARHCLGAGPSTIGVGGQVFRAVEQIPHPTADIALIKLDRPSGTAPMTLSSNNLSFGEKTIAAGWGGITHGHAQWAEATTQRRVTNVPGPDRQAVLIEQWISQGILRQGDSGGPLMEGNAVVGVLSMTSHTGTVGWYTPVAERTEWISAISGASKPPAADAPSPLIDATAFPTVIPLPSFPLPFHSH